MYKTMLGESNSSLFKAKFTKYALLQQNIIQPGFF